MKVVDNFLQSISFEHLKKRIISASFPLYFNSAIINDYVQLDPSIEENDITHLNFAHTLYTVKSGVCSEYYNFIRDCFFQQLDIRAIIRSKVNCYPRTEKIIEHSLHNDFSYNHKGVILSLNTCDGYTLFEDGTKVESVANRALFFDPSIRHASTSCTDQKCRWNIIINHF